jgi:hypothetical protein
MYFSSPPAYIHPFQLTLLDLMALIIGLLVEEYK